MPRARNQGPEREERIAMEAVVDCYDESERAMGWFYYLQGKISFPFFAKCKSKRAISPLEIGDAVKVKDMGPEDECAKEIFVLAEWKKIRPAVPLAQLGVDDEADDDTEEAVGDWHYRVEMGYQL